MLCQSYYVLLVFICCRCNQFIANNISMPDIQGNGLVLTLMYVKLKLLCVYTAECLRITKLMYIVVCIYNSTYTVHV